MGGAGVVANEQIERLQQLAEIGQPDLAADRVELGIQRQLPAQLCRIVALGRSADEYQLYRSELQQGAGKLDEIVAGPGADRIAAPRRDAHDAKAAGPPGQYAVANLVHDGLGGRV